MGIVFVLLPLSVFLAVLGYLGYHWAVRNGQFDDLETPPMRVLVEDEMGADKIGKGDEKAGDLVS